MRNLKRALSLALASVMLVGLMVVGTGASYVDVSSKNNVEAIEVLQALGVMTGDENGKFNPDQKVTRNEMAVIMANLLKLSVTDFTGSRNPFTDVPAWAQPYVTACYADNIIAGTSATTFGGSGNVTAVQAGLMLMKALGYFQYTEDFGDDWQLATVKQASEIELYDGIDAGRTDALTRNEVARMVLNALEADVVDFTGTVGTDIKTTDGTTIKVGYKSEYTAQTTRYDYDDSKDNVRQLVEELFTDDVEKSAGTADAFGRPSTKWEYKNDEIGTYADEADLTYTVSVESGEIYDDLGLSKNIAKGKVDERIDGAAAVNDKPIAEDNETAKFGAKGAVTEVYYDKDAKTAIVVTINTYLAQVDGEYDEDDEELDLDLVEGTADPGLTGKNPWTLSSDDFDGLSSFGDEDYVLITVAKGKIKTIQAAEVINATVTSYTKEKNVTADGTKYEYNISYTDAATRTYNVKEEYTLVLDANGYVIYSDAAEADDKVVYVAEFGQAGSVKSNMEADAYFPDGTNEVITLHNDSDEVVVGDTNAGWYTYSMKSGKYVLKAAEAATKKDAAEGKQVTENGKTKISDGTNDFRGNSKTVFILNDDGDVKVYTGIKNVPDVQVKDDGKAETDLTATVAVIKDGGYASYVYIDVTDAKVKGSSSSSDDRIYILDADPNESVDENDNTYFTYDAIVNGEETTINATSGSWAVGLYFDATYDEDGYVDDMDQVIYVADFEDEDFAKLNENPWTSRKVFYDDGVLSFGKVGETASKAVILADSYSIFVVDSDGDVSTVTASKLARDYGTNGIAGDAYVALDDDGFATEIYVQLA